MIYHLPAVGGSRLLVGLIITLKSEGARTARVDFEVDRLDDITVDPIFEAVLAPSSSGQQVDTHVRTRQLVMEPGEVRQVLVRCGPTLDDWVSSERPKWWGQAYGIRAWSEREGAWQNWSVPLATRMFSASPTEPTMVILLARTAKNLAMVEDEPRTYP